MRPCPPPPPPPPPPAPPPPPSPPACLLRRPLSPSLSPVPPLPPTPTSVASPAATVFLRLLCHRNRLCRSRLRRRCRMHQAREARTAPRAGPLSAGDQCSCPPPLQRSRVGPPQPTAPPAGRLRPLPTGLRPAGCLHLCPLPYRRRPPPSARAALDLDAGCCRAREESAGGSEGRRGRPRGEARAGAARGEGAGLQRWGGRRSPDAGRAHAAHGQPGRQDDGWSANGVCTRARLEEGAKPGARLQAVAHEGMRPGGPQGPRPRLARSQRHRCSRARERRCTAVLCSPSPEEQGYDVELTHGDLGRPP
ncbi:hypothetical protein PVAP13_2NG474303 [Panicum virgatum]|uniref:Uncharacterized protein n=1 Tax=Panicum virgatum TaxID=38727 RepID=A0A8T0VUA6_PANVG|nr:hypothetical protein PVAP13_2NG474303 [Panicum virgatum]